MHQGSSRKVWDVEEEKKKLWRSDHMQNMKTLVFQETQTLVWNSISRTQITICLCVGGVFQLNETYSWHLKHFTLL